MIMFINESMKVPARVWAEVAEMILNADFTSSLSLIRVPVLVLWGDHDSICPIEDQHSLLAALNDATFIPYKETGHALHWEDGDAFVRDVTTFIRRIGGPTTKKGS